MDTSDEITEESYQNVEEAEQFKSEWIKLELEPIITIPQLDDLKTQLEQYKNCRVQISGQQVERIDTAAFQLLLAFTNSPDVTVAWVDPSPELCNVSKLLGLSAVVSVPMQEN
ncbi:STAS domain-containing protein [Candidatus Halobeggiatoa sp. HSG11]|nr:STAS domain-containing protein [Candidatus Halobeggiatoa sp. HSG11]